MTTLFQCESRASVQEWRSSYTGHQYRSIWWTKIWTHDYLERWCRTAIVKCDPWLPGPQDPLLKNVKEIPSWMPCSMSLNTWFAILGEKCDNPQIRCVNPINSYCQFECIHKTWWVNLIPEGFLLNEVLPVLLQLA